MSDPINLNVQTSDYGNIPTRPAELIGWLISWLIWGYAWAVTAAISIYFIESKADFFATLENLLILIIWPFYATLVIGYTKILYPLYCLFSQCFYGFEGLFYIIKIRGGKQPPYVPPKYCGGENSSGCAGAPGDPGKFTRDYMFCSHKRGKNGGCQYKCQQ